MRDGAPSEAASTPRTDAPPPQARHNPTLPPPRLISWPRSHHRQHLNQHARSTDAFGHTTFTSTQQQRIGNKPPSNMIGIRFQILSCILRVFSCEIRRVWVWVGAHLFPRLKTTHVGCWHQLVSNLKASSSARGVTWDFHAAFSIKQYFLYFRRDVLFFNMLYTTRKCSRNE